MDHNGGWSRRPNLLPPQKDKQLAIEEMDTSLETYNPPSLNHKDTEKVIILITGKEVDHLTM